MDKQQCSYPRLPLVFWYTPQEQQPIVLPTQIINVNLDTDLNYVIKIQKCVNLDPNTPPVCIDE